MVVLVVVFEVVKIDEVVEVVVVVTEVSSFDVAVMSRTISTGCEFWTLLSQFIVIVLLNTKAHAAIETASNIIKLDTK